MNDETAKCLHLAKLSLSKEEKKRKEGKMKSFNEWKMLDWYETGDELDTSKVK